MKSFIVCPLSELPQPRKDTLFPAFLPTIFLQCNVVTKWPWRWAILSLPHRAGQHTVPLIENYIATLFHVKLLKRGWEHQMSEVCETLLSAPYCALWTFQLKEDRENRVWKFFKDCLESRLFYCKFLLLSLCTFWCLL